MGTCALAGLGAADLMAELFMPDSLSSKTSHSIPVLKALNSEIAKIDTMLADRGASDIERWDTCFLPLSVPDTNHINFLDGLYNPCS